MTVLQRTAGNRAVVQLKDGDPPGTPAPPSGSKGDGPQGAAPVTTTLADVTTIGDVAALTPDAVAGFGLTGKVKQAAADDRAEPLLRGPFGSNWFHAKDVLLKGKDLPPDRFKAHKEDVFGQLMDGLLGLREKQYNELLKDIKTTRLADLTDPVDPTRPVAEDDRLVWSAAGSATRTSDIDVNLKGIGSIQAVSLFNNLFKSELGYPYEPGSVFDVNVYAKDMMVGAAGKPSSGNPMREVRPKSGGTPTKHKGQAVEIVPNQEVELEGLDYADFADDQEVWSLVHTRRYMTAQEWAVYRHDMTAGGTDVELLGKMVLAESRFAQYQHTLKEKEAQIIAMSDAAAKAWGPLQAILRAGEQASSYERGAAEMLVANQVYADKLVRVQQLRDELEVARVGLKAARAAAAIGLELKNAISEALMYANEVYVTQGAIHHAVIGTQIGRGMAKKVSKVEEGSDEDRLLTPEEKMAPDFASVDIALPTELFMHAFEENVGDFLKATAGHSHGLAADLAHGGKYLDRMMEAAGKIGIDTSSIPHFDPLRVLGADFAENKARSEANPEIDAGAVSAARVGKDISLPTPTHLRQLVIALSVAVRRAYQLKRSKGGTGSLSVPPPGGAAVQGPTTQDPAAAQSTVRSLVATIEENLRQAAANIPVVPPGKR